MDDSLLLSASGLGLGFDQTPFVNNLVFELNGRTAGRYPIETYTGTTEGVLAPLWVNGTGVSTDVVSSTDSPYREGAEGRSLHFAGAASYLYTHSAITRVLPGSADFTLEYWVKTTRPASTQRIFDLRGCVGVAYASLFTAMRMPTQWRYFDVGASNLNNSAYGTGGDNAAPGLGPLVPDEWFHHTYERQNNVFRSYVNGVPKYAVTYGAAINVGMATHGISLGFLFNNSWGGTSAANKSHHFQGFLTGLRFFKGVSLYKGRAFNPNRMPSIR